MSDYQCFEITKPMLVRTFLEQHISQRALKSLKYEGGIQVNGQNRTVRYQLEAGDILELFYPDERAETKLQPWYFPLHILYEDADLMVVRKPCGIPSIPTRRYPFHTLANIIIAYYEMQHISSTVHLVSRLDKDTAGIILVAKNRRMHHLLENNFERRYRLWIEGTMPKEVGIIDAPIGRKADSIKRLVMPKGKKAITHYRVIWTDGKQSLVEAKLETGRTHQIRVHFSHLGHALLGDVLYGKAHPLFKGQALYSYYLAFKHPSTKQEMVFQDLPSCFDETFFQVVD